MFPPKTIARFAVSVAVIYAVLVWLGQWSAFDRAYQAYFRGLGDSAFSQFWFWPQAKVRFLDADGADLMERVNAVLPGRLPEGFQPPQSQGVRDTLMVLMNRDVPSVPGLLRTSSQIIGFTPTAVMLALALGTPVAWKRRAWLLFWGMVLVHLFIIGRLTVLLLNGGFAAQGKRYALFQPGSFMADVLRRADIVLCDNPTFSYLVSVVFWVMVLFGFEFWATIRARRARGAAGQSKPRAR